MERLQRYIDRGGNLFIVGESGRQALMNPLVEQFGVEFVLFLRDDEGLENECHYAGGYGIDVFYG